ncbi:ribose transport system ATP-binding protein/rhamnose transport system ATP-binding protein [Labrys monachus]|uniref:Ribose transport system ATP-binding protein/rhamnose transport system ATP-binding protein n=1 Tax=Labrys monachus TaxID=217067 RepID=A0ABU0FCP6_9HYPH|nr:ATP-binding cassette domain-containing protein [Labrys monachus]MDQ0392382.1 ribose transport system ATP-binding protein/rhamnose transport system ATP-binding protein [Labrys monachus]
MAGPPPSRLAASGTAVIGLAHAGKRFGGTVALTDASFDLRAGEVVALLGENGAGKSTCVKLLAGVYRPDSGAVTLDGKPVDWRSPLDARRHGIAVIHQHPGLFADLTVAENVFLGHMPRGFLGGVDQARMERETAALIEVVGLGCRPDDRLDRLRTSEQQLVEIARALSMRARVLIMDEPTASLSQREVERLFAVVADLRARGVAMMFVGHRMDEIYRVADRIAVLRDGHLVGVEAARDLDRDKAVRMMIGRTLSSIFPAREAVRGEVALDVRSLSREGEFGDISFQVRRGEILGLGGLVGSGRTEIARALFGITQPDAGEILVEGTPRRFASPDEAMAARIAYVSEDRLGQSLVMDFSILSNAVLPVIGQATIAGMVWRPREVALVGPHLERLRLKFRSFDQAVKTLSGGNQQKVVLSKWLATDPKILILDEPTQGIDVRTKAEVHAMIAELARQGLAIILISSELPELLGMCDRILVLREGRMTAEFDGGDVDQERVIRAATDADGTAPPPVALPAVPEAGLLPTGTAARGGPSFLRRLVARREAGLVAAIAAVVIPVSVLNPRMLGAANLDALAMDAGLLMIVAAAQMLVMLTRNIDLSVASVIGLAAYGSASFMHEHPSMPVVAGVAVACLIGFAAGLLNGAVVTLGRVPSIVVTLGTLAVFRGANSLWAGGRQISADQVSQAWLDMTSARFAGVPAVILIAIAALAVVAWFLRRLPLGRELYAVGSNPEGAALMGIRSRWLVLGAFAVAGLLAGFDGALWASRYATVDARVASGFELTVIAAVVVGGVALRGGAGTVPGIVLGALTLLVIRNGLTLVRVDPLWLDGVYGLIILMAIGIDAAVAHRARLPGGGAR